MPVSGLVVSLRDEPHLRDEALAAIGRQPQITMGLLERNRLAIVVDTTSSQEDRRLWQWLSSLPGISLLEVALVGFEQQTDSTPLQAGHVPSATSCNPNVGRKDNLQDGR